MREEPKSLPSLEYLRDHYNFSEEGVMTLRKKAGKYDNSRPVGSILGSPDKDGYLTLSILGESYKVHRLVFYNEHGWCPDLVDHWDQDKSNNRPSNLRPADSSQSCENRPKFKGKSSKKKGVSWHKRRQKYQVRIRVRGNLIHLGYADAEDEAHARYCEAALKYHGEYASFD